MKSGVPFATLKTEARLVHRVSGEARHVFRRGIRSGFTFPIDTVRIDKTRALHLQLFRQRVQSEQRNMSRGVNFAPASTDPNCEPTDDRACKPRFVRLHRAA